MLFMSYLLLSRILLNKVMQFFLDLLLWDVNSCCTLNVVSTRCVIESLRHTVCCLPTFSFLSIESSEMVRRRGRKWRVGEGRNLRLSVMTPTQHRDKENCLGSIWDVRGRIFPSNLSFLLSVPRWTAGGQATM